MSFDIREITRDFKINYIIAIIACIFGVDGGLFAYRVSTLFYNVHYIGTVMVLASILSLLGIYYFKRDYRLTIAIYIIAGIVIILVTSMDEAIISFILYIIAAVVAYYESNNLDNNEKDSNDDIHYYN